MLHKPGYLNLTPEPMYGFSMEGETDSMKLFSALIIHAHVYTDTCILTINKTTHKYKYTPNI